MTQKIKMLIVDDELPQLSILNVCFKKRGFDVYSARSGEEGLDLFKKEHPEIVLTDMRMGAMTGIELLKNIKNISPQTEVIIITAYSDIDVAIDALRNGAADFILKPVDLENLVQSVKNAVERRKIMAEHKKNNKIENIKSIASVNKIITNDAKMLKLIETAKIVAKSKATVIIRGASGTGKELLAHVIQQHSPRANQPFVVVNCAALNENLLESELFGHCKGAFTGAIQDRKGRFEEANSGTIFLDEIGDIPLGTQVKLLRVLQEGEIQKVGENKTVNVDVRIIAATNQDLERMLAARTFRSDLYYRLNVITFELPALKNRPDDIPLLANYFIKQYAEKMKIEPPKLSDAALNTLKNYDFPGNIRELENIIQRTLVITESNVIDKIFLPENSIIKNHYNKPVDINDSIDEGNESLDALLEKVERKKIIETLEKERYNLANTAKRLGISLRQLRYRIKKLGIK